MWTRLVKGLHGRVVFERRIRVLTTLVTEVLPEGARVLDVGCGDGRVARALMDARPDLEITGIDTVVREQTAVPVELFDGDRIPHEDGSVDAVLLVDVLHHTTDPLAVLRECVRVSRRCLVIKDHTADGDFAHRRLRFMDRVGNPQEIHLAYDYWSHARWAEAIEELGLAVGSWEEQIHLFPPPLDWIFGRGLHFVARLDLPG